LLRTLTLIAQATPALAATEDECDRSWNVLDTNRRGVLRGDDAQRFMHDMRSKGVQVHSRTGEITAAPQYRRACIKDFWANLDEEGR
jgi:hypothetical protein